MNRYIVVNSIKSGTKFTKLGDIIIYVQDLAVIGFFFLISIFFQDFVMEDLQLPFIIFNIIVGIVMVSPSKYNRGKKMWQTVYLYLSANHETYKGLSNKSLEILKEQMLNEIKEEK